ncbi:MAG: flagellar hook protein FlgE [Bryobacteraceae bacterium]
MFNSFSSALSSLKAHSTAIDTVGHNLANVNTTGFKTSSVAFKDLVSESMGSGREAGMGVNRPLTVRSFNQGAIQSSSGQLDAAIQGNGFFVVKDSEGAQFYTRDGGFRVDREGYMVTLTGERVQKYVNGSVSDIQVPAGAAGARQTSVMSMIANLDAAGIVGQSSGSFSTPIEVVDSLGTRHTLTVEFTKSGTNEWGYDVFIPGEDVGDTAPVSVVTPGTITFNADGTIATPDAASGTVDIDITGLVNGASDLSLTWNLYNSDQTPTLTQFSQTSAVTKVSQDGFASAELLSVGMQDGGSIVARYANGDEKEVGKLAIALVSNPESMVGAGNNNFRTSTESSDPVIGISGVGGRGKIKSGALEASTVDIAREFTNLIVFQRGYQANSRVITTADELSQEVLNLKR